MQQYNSYPSNLPNGQPYPPQPYYAQSYQQWPDPALLMQALMPSYTAKACLTLIVYFFGYFPGLILNIVFLIDAASTKRRFNQTPQGMGCLAVMLAMSIVTMLFLFIGVGFTFVQMYVGQ